jgi:acyl-CoA thioesterase FadM
MKQLFRLLKILLFSRFRSKMEIFDESTVHFRVWPNDLDPYLHMNNGVYLTLLDIGRVDLMIRTGMMKVAKQHGFYPVVASEAIKFRISLTPFARFAIQTKMVGWDERYFYISQKYIWKDQVAASAIIKGRILSKKGGKVAPAEVFTLLGRPVQSPPLPSVVGNFLLVDEDLH